MGNYYSNLLYKSKQTSCNIGNYKNPCRNFACIFELFKLFSKYSSTTCMNLNFYLLWNLRAQFAQISGTLLKIKRPLKYLQFCRSIHQIKAPPHTNLPGQPHLVKPKSISPSKPQVCAPNRGTQLLCYFNSYGPPLTASYSNFY